MRNSVACPWPQRIRCRQGAESYDMVAAEAWPHDVDRESPKVCGDICAQRPDESGTTLPGLVVGDGYVSGQQEGHAQQVLSGIARRDVFARPHMETYPGVRAQVADARLDGQAPPRAAATSSSAAPRGPGSWRSQKLSYSSRQVCSSNSLSAMQICADVDKHCCFIVFTRYQAARERSRKEPPSEIMIEPEPFSTQGIPPINLHPHARCSNSQ